MTDKRAFTESEINLHRDYDAAVDRDGYENVGDFHDWLISECVRLRKIEARAVERYHAPQFNSYIETMAYVLYGDTPQPEGDPDDR